MGVLITNQQNLRSIREDLVRKTARALLSDLGNPDSELSILLTDDAGIETINRAYFNRPRPTNVISFSMMEGEFSDVNPNASMLGDIVVSVETAVREAREAGIPEWERIAELLVHGLLHIVGYDHEAPDADSAAMEARSARLMEMLGSEGLLDEFPVQPEEPAERRDE